MGRKVNQLNVYLLVAALIIGSVTGYVLGLRPIQEMLTKMNQLESELASLKEEFIVYSGLRTSQEMVTKMNQLESELVSLKEEFIAYSGRDWHLVFSHGEAFKDTHQVVRNSLGPFYLSGNEVRFVWLFQSQGFDDGVPGTLEITLRYANGTSVGRRTTCSAFSIGSADMDLRAAGNYTIGFMATGCVDTFIWVWDYG
jgi:hypothetical protein